MTLNRWNSILRLPLLLSLILSLLSPLSVHAEDAPADGHAKFQKFITSTPEERQTEDDVNDLELDPDADDIMACRGTTKYSVWLDDISYGETTLIDVGTSYVLLKDLTRWTWKKSGMSLVFQDPKAAAGAIAQGVKNFPSALVSGAKNLPGAIVTRATSIPGAIADKALGAIDTVKSIPGAVKTATVASVAAKTARASRTVAVTIVRGGTGVAKGVATALIVVPAGFAYEAFDKQNIPHMWPPQALIDNPDWFFGLPKKDMVNYARGSITSWNTVFDPPNVQLQDMIHAEAQRCRDLAGPNLDWNSPDVQADRKYHREHPNYNNIDEVWTPEWKAYISGGPM